MQFELTIWRSSPFECDGCLKVFYGCTPMALCMETFVPQTSSVRTLSSLSVSSFSTSFGARTVASRTVTAWNDNPRVRSVYSVAKHLPFRRLKSVLSSVLDELSAGDTEGISDSVVCV